MPTIKLIATDMDGTFLNSNKDYDRKRFNRIFQQLQAQDITFVVASGNQVAQLQSFFRKISVLTLFLPAITAVLFIMGKNS